jgi:very-short-patch-repair endonuclease
MSAISLPPPAGGRSRDAAGGPGEGLSFAALLNPSPGSAAPSPTSPRRGEVARARAKALRANMAPAEVLMWEMLRAGRLNGWKFARQVPIGPYIADFAARREKLVIEIDGRSHDHTVAHDQRREAFLNSLGYTILHLGNAAVTTDRDSIARQIDHLMRTLAPATKGR